MRTGPSYAHTSPSQLIKNIFMAYCATIFSNTWQRQLETCQTVLMVNTGLLDHLAKIKQLFLQALLWRDYLINTHSEVLFFKIEHTILKSIVCSIF